MLLVALLKRASLILSLAGVTSLFAAEQSELFDPPAVYLQWQRDPATTMTVHWHTTNRAKSLVEFRKLDDTEWQSRKGTSAPLPDATFERIIHTVELTELSPKTDYVFRFGEKSREFKFRTMPKELREPFRFIQGGDVYHKKEWMDPMNALAGRFDPAFVVIGGDLAYANNRNSTVELSQRWVDYFDSWKKNAVTPDGRLIPMLVTLGNHEVKGFWGRTPKDAPGFYALFSMPGAQGYNHLDFGNYLTLLLLDSGHTHPVSGAQTEWLRGILEKRKKVPHIFPIYHIPAYPSVRDDDGGENGTITQEIRELWCPLFERYGVKVAFEHHDHAFKRTYPMLNGKQHPKGIVYLGDGAWGVGLRKTETEGPRDYIAKAGPIRHFFVVTLYPTQRHILAVNEKGEIFDEVYQEVERK